MKKKLLTILFAVLVFSIPVLSVVNGQPLTDVLKDLRAELKLTRAKSQVEQQAFDEDFGKQHQHLIDVLTQSNELSLLLYTQEQEMTFDLAYALNKVSSAYVHFNRERRPYDRIVTELNIEIDRYARLIEALRRLPPVKTEIEIEIVPDSLLYHSDSLQQQISELASSLEREVIRIAIKDSLSSPFVLDEEGEIHRDSCILYASEMLKQHASNRATVVADSMHYQVAYFRMKEAYDYAQSRYRDLERYVFTDGLPSFLDLVANPKFYWNKMVLDLQDQYDFSELASSRHDSMATRADSLVLAAGLPEEGNKDLFYGLSSKGANSTLVVVGIIQIMALAVFWVIAYLLVLLLSRIKRVKAVLPKSNRPLFSLLLGTFLYFVVLGFSVGADSNEYIRLSAKHINTFLWLLFVISASLLMRVKQEHIRHSFWLYVPTFIIAITIIFCRICFAPDRLMNIIFPPILALAVLRQLFFCIWESGKATPTDSAFGWVSLAIYLVSFGYAFFGYTFVALLILIWWYFQLAVILTIVCIADLLARYKERWLDRRVEAMRSRINYVSGQDRESLLFGATWFYDFVRQVAVPVMALLSVPMCIHMSLEVFDFDDLYYKIFYEPFVRLVDKDGIDTLRISGVSIIGLMILLFALRYFNRAMHALFQYLSYAAFMRKHKRTSIRDNEINLSLGNSIITVIVWMTYVIVVVDVWRIPTGSLTLVAGGLSAGIGLALKDIINNFIYGIQLMGARLRVGDWIECDGVRGRVVAINYQCVVVETVEGTEMSFLNASLFGKNFNNLTRNNSYEFTKIICGVAYGTDVKKVREALMEAMKQMCTKDKYGRDIVDMSQYGGNGFYVAVNEMADSSVDIAVKQYVLVPERIGYIDRAKEVIYDAINNAGITIPFPQCDVHLINDDK